MHWTPIADITISASRQRREFDEVALVELRESIERLGLMHPIVVREKEGILTLVAGERRLRAVKEIYDLGGELKHASMTLPFGEVPVVHMGELSPLDAYEAELAENTVRADLTWQEQAEAVSRFHKLRLMQNPTQTVGATALEITGTNKGDQRDVVRQQILIAASLNNPVIAKAKDVKEAFKLLKRDEDMKNFALKGLEVGKTFGAHVHKVIHGDCLEHLAQFPEGSFDVICTDPPYGMDADSFGDGAGRLTGITHAYSDSEASFRGLLECVAPLLGRVAKPSAALYLCCDVDQFGWLRSLFRIHGWYVFRTPLINVKAGSGRVPLPTQGPRRQYETILFAFRGGKLTNAIQPDVITTTLGESLGHGAQKPVELYTNLLARSVRPGDSVLDPFAGSGPIFPAAHGLKCAATGIEMEQQYYGMCVKRVEELK